jgi:hypothetical protein
VGLLKLGPTTYQAGLRRERWFESLRWVLTHSHGDASPCPLTRPLNDADWDGLLACVGEQRIAGHLAAAIDAGLPATAAQRDQARAARQTAVMTDLGVEQAACGLAGLLGSRDIRWRLIKGVAAARVLYPDPVMRSTGDVDVIVHPADFEAAIDFIRTWDGAPWEYWGHGPASRRAAAARTFIHTTNIELDVHREIRGHGGRYALPTDLVFARPQPLEVQGRPAKAPPTPVVVLHAMLHLSKGGPQFGRLSTLADLLWARRQLPADYDEALRLAAQAGCATPAAWADRVVTSWLFSSASESTVARTSPWRMWAFDRAVGTPILGVPMRLFVGPSRLRRTWEAVVPEQQFREQQGRTASSQVRHLAARLFTGRSGR